MTVIPKTPRNPYGLTTKQKMVIEKALEFSARGEGLKMVDAHDGIYASKKRANLATMSYRNMSKDHFRAALMEGLMKRGIVGRDGKVEEVLTSGLDATDKDGNANHETRLKFAQEINKISGVYAPEKKETARFNLNIDLTPEQINEKIKELQGELGE